MIPAISARPYMAEDPAAAWPRPVLSAITKPGFALLLCAVDAAIKSSGLLQTVADDPDSTSGADRSQRMNCALKAVKRV